MAKTTKYFGRITGINRHEHGSIVTVAILTLCVLFLWVQTGESSDRDQAIKTVQEIGRTYTAAESRSDPFDPSGNLDEYLDYAARNNPGVRAAFYEWKADLERVSSVSALPDPFLSYGYFIEDIETRVGPQRHRFGVKQNIPWFGTLGARGDEAFERAQAAYEKYQSAKLKLFYRVKQAYYEYYYLGRELTLTRENFELMKFWESIIRKRYETALERHPDLIKAQVELGLLEDRIRSLEQEINPTAARLRAALDLPDTVDLPLPDTVAIEADIIDRDLIMALVLDRNPDLQAIKYLIEKEKAAIRLAGKSSYPHFTVGVDYIEVGKPANPDLPGGGKDSWMVSVGINLPIWFGKNRSLKEEARARSRVAQDMLKQARNDLQAYADMVLFEYADNRRKIELYRDGLVPKAEQSLNASYAAYQSGESDFLSVLDAQRQLLDFYLILDRAYTDAALKKAELEMLAGVHISEERQR